MNNNPPGGHKLTELEATAKEVTLDLSMRSPHWKGGYGLRLVGVSHRSPEGLRGNFISHIQPGSPAELCLELSVGDELVSVGGTYVRDKPHRECLDILKVCFWSWCDTSCSQ